MAALQLRRAHGRQYVQRARAQGLDESNSPQFAEAIAFLKRAQQQMHKLQNGLRAWSSTQACADDAAPQNGANGSEAPAPTSPPLGALTQGQHALLRCQIYALKLLMRNMPVPPNVQLGCHDVEAAIRLAQVQQQGGQPTAAASAPALNGAAAPAVEDDEQDEDPDKLARHTPATSSVYPYTSFTSPAEFLRTVASRPDAFSRVNPRSVLVPTLLPRGLDPHTLREERDRFIGARIQQRVRELEQLPALLEGPAKVRALIELKSLNLLARQKALRDDVVRSFGQANQLSLVSERTAFKRARKLTQRDARQTEAMERKQKDERERKSKSQHQSRIHALATHAAQMMSAHAAHDAITGRLGKAVLRFHADAEREEAKRIEKVSKDRLRALKADDEEAYLKLIDRTKDTRITHLIRQTDTYLDKLSAAVQRQQRGAQAPPAPIGKVSESDFGAAPVFDETEEDKAQAKTDYYNDAHKIKEVITRQPAMLSGGELKDYQIKGLQWMMSLYNNNLNGILADEMVRRRSEFVADRAGPRQDDPDHRPAHLPHREQAAERAIPRHRPAVDHDQLGARVWSLGARAPLHRVQGQPEHAAQPARADAARVVPRPPHDVRVHHQGPPDPRQDQVGAHECVDVSAGRADRQSSTRATG